MENISETSMFAELMSQPEHSPKTSIFENCAEYQTPVNQRAFYEAGLKECILSEDVWELHLETRKN